MVGCDAGQTVTIALGDTSLRVTDQYRELIVTVLRNIAGDITRFKAHGTARERAAVDPSSLMLPTCQRRSARAIGTSIKFCSRRVGGWCLRWSLPGAGTSAMNSRMGTSTAEHPVLTPPGSAVARTRYPRRRVDEPTDMPPLTRGVHRLASSPMTARSSCMSVTRAIPVSRTSKRQWCGPGS